MADWKSHPMRTESRLRTSSGVIRRTAATGYLIVCWSLMLTSASQSSWNPPETYKWSVYWSRNHENCLSTSTDRVYVCRNECSSPVNPIRVFKREENGRLRNLNLDLCVGVVGQGDNTIGVYLEWANCESEPLDPDMTWDLEFVTGSNAFQIRNRGLPDRCVNLKASAYWAATSGPCEELNELTDVYWDFYLYCPAVGVELIVPRDRHSSRAPLDLSPLYDGDEITCLSLTLTPAGRLGLDIYVGQTLAGNNINIKVHHEGLPCEVITMGGLPKAPTVSQSQVTSAYSKCHVTDESPTWCLLGCANAFSRHLHGVCDVLALDVKLEGPMGNAITLCEIEVLY